MKYFFQNKINIILTVLLVGVLGVTAYFFLPEIINSSVKEVTSADCVNYTVEEARKWAEENKVEVVITYEFSDEVEEGKLISQNPEAGQPITDKLELVYSKGEDPDSYVQLPEITENTKRSDMEKFFAENNFTDVTYEYQINEKEKDTVLSLNVSGKVKRDALIMVYLSSGKETENVEIIVPDLKTYSLNEARAWASSNAITLRIDYNVSDTVEKGDIMAQSVAKGTKVSPGASITITISDGKGITIPDFTGKTKADVEAWKKEYKVESVTYKTADSDTVKEDGVISISPKPGTVISADYPVTVTLSKGAKVSVEKGYEGKTIAEFTKYIEDLGLTVKDTGKMYYSNTYANGTVFSYDTGLFAAKSVINYSLSKGKYTVNVNDFNNKTKQQVESFIAVPNSENAGITVNYVNTETADTSKVDKTFDCSANGTAVSCKIGVKTVPQINASEYNNLSKADAQNKINIYHNTYGEGSITFSYGDAGTADTTYNCSVKGKNAVACLLYRPQINASEYNGLTVAEATNKINNYKNTYGTGNISTPYVDAGSDVGKTYGCVLSGSTVNCKVYRAVINETDYDGKTQSEAQNMMNSYNSTYGVGSIGFSNADVTDQSLNGKTFGCTLSGTSVSCNVGVYHATAEIGLVQEYNPFFAGTTYEETAANMRNVLSAFSNLTIQGASSDKAVGQILSISVNGNTSYEPALYPVDTTTIVIVICDNRIQ